MNAPSIALACALALAVAPAACGVAEPLEDRRVGIIREVDGALDVVVPDTVTLGVAFDVRVTTLGGDCVRKDETELEVSGTTATVTPYDRYAIPRPGFGCLPTGTVFVHVAEVTFAAAGEAVVVVRGREESSDAVTDHPFPVVVRP